MPTDGFEHLDEIIKAYRKTNVLFSAYKLGILDKISGDDVTINELAGELKLSLKGLRRLLSAL